MFSSLSIIYGGVVSEHCVGATGLGLGTSYVYTYVRIYAFSIYLIYTADVMRVYLWEERPRADMKNICQLPSTQYLLFAFCSQRKTMLIAFCGRLQSDSVLEMRESCHADVGNPLPPSPVTMLPV